MKWIRGLGNWFLMLIIVSCSSDEPVIRLPGFEVPTIYGYNIVDDSGEFYGKVGNPNVDLGGLKASIFCYPNPVRDRLNVYVICQEPGEYQMWMVPGIYAGPTPQPPIQIGSTNMIVGGTPIVEITGSGPNRNHQIDLQDQPTGFYRIYLKAGDELLYDNLYVLKGS